MSLLPALKHILFYLDSYYDIPNAIRGELLFHLPMEKPELSSCVKGKGASMPIVAQHETFIYSNVVNTI